MPAETKQVIRSTHGRDNPFVRIANVAVQDGRLSFRARGVLAFVLSKPDNFRHSAESLAKQGTEGREAMEKAITELKALGYCRRVTERDPESGRLKSRNVFFEQPTTGIQESDEASTDNGIPVVGPTTVYRDPANRLLENRDPVNRGTVSQECIKRLSNNDGRITTVEETKDAERECISAEALMPKGNASAHSAPALRPQSGGLDSFTGKNWPTILGGHPNLAHAWKGYVDQWEIEGKDEEFIRINLIKRALYAGMPVDDVIDALEGGDYGGVVLVKRCKEFLGEDPGRTGTVPA